MIDSTNPKVLKLYDVQTGKPLSVVIEHSNEIKEFELNNAEVGANNNARRIVFLDANKDLFISPTLKKDIVVLRM